ncbi:MAG: hypothetical protein EA425_03920 [Puniceicoccaceae bacterium]|nr:MAG: hypothetical protein EA425_03920 [Puniceicoccaceae bacterium]
MLALASLTLAAPFAHGAPSVHGSVSAALSYSDTYNYLGNTRKNVDLNQVDVILNATHRFDSGLRVGAQIYAFKLGSFKDLTLDFANLDYSFDETFGLRAGRIKLPIGLYNDSQDLDAIRTFASLPLGFYPKTLRAVTASLDGALAYGRIGLGGAGTLDYQVFGGAKESISGDTPFLRGFSGLNQVERWKVRGFNYGGAFFYEPPIDGLRIGYSYTRVNDNRVFGHLGRTDLLTGDDLATALMVDQMLGAGTWDFSGMFAGTSTLIDNLDVTFRVLSLEFMYDRWLFAAEYKLLDLYDGNIHLPAMALLGQPVDQPLRSAATEYYGMVTYQATDQIGVGAYYAYSLGNRHASGASSNPNQRTHDYALAVSYAPTPSLILKLEGHYLDGRSFIGGDGQANPATDRTWTYFIFKSTFSF